MDHPPPQQDLTSETSIELIQRARRGDRRALDRLFQRYVPPLRRWARGRLPYWAREVVDTDDVVQDTLLRTLSRIETFEPRGEGALQGYMRQTLRHRVVDEVRKAGRRPAPDPISEGRPHHGASPLEEVIGQEAIERYEEALERLTDQEREAIVSRIELGFDYEQIALAMGKPSPDAARMAVSRALVRLAREMDHE